ncbi:MAG: phage holin family protein [Balneolaceae bacterium]
MSAENQHTSGEKGLPGEVREYIEKRIQLATLTISEKVSKIISNSIQKVAGIILLTCGFLFAWFALCYYLAELLNNIALGFLVGSVPLFLAGIILYKTKLKSLTEKIQADMIAGVLEKVEPENRKEKNNGKASE